MKTKDISFLIEREGKYYFTFPHVPETTEQLVYAMCDSPMGPFEYQGVIMEESPDKCWTNHHSIVNIAGQPSPNNPADHKALFLQHA